MPKFNYPFLFNATVTLVKQRGLGPNTLAFRVPHNFSKPHIQSYFEQLYGVEIVNINTLNKDPKTYVVNGRMQYRRRKFGFKKAFITFNKPFEADWSAFHKQPHLIYNLHNKHLRARGHKVSGAQNDLSLEKRRAAPE